MVPIVLRLNGAHCATIVGDWLESLGKPDTNKEKHIWLIREREIKARRNNKKRPNSIQRKNENRKEKRKEKDQTPGRRTRLSIFPPFEKVASRFASKVRHLWCVKKTSAGEGNPHLLSEVCISRLLALRVSEAKVGVISPVRPTQFV